MQNCGVVEAFLTVPAVATLAGAGVQQDHAHRERAKEEEVAKEDAVHEAGDLAEISYSTRASTGGWITRRGGRGESRRVRISTRQEINKPRFSP